MKESAIFVSSTAKALIEQRIQFNTGKWGLINLDRSNIYIDRDGGNIQLYWSF